MFSRKHVISSFIPLVVRKDTYYFNVLNLLTLVLSALLLETWGSMECQRLTLELQEYVLCGAKVQGGDGGVPLTAVSGGGDVGTSLCIHNLRFSLCHDELANPQLGLSSWC